MKERPILFSAPMVRALLEGRKTQTRRIVKGYEKANLRRVLGPGRDGTFDFVFPREGYPEEDGNGHLVKCPYGVPGDRLWVRETFVVESNRQDMDPEYLPPFKDGRPVTWHGCAADGVWWEQAHYRATEPTHDITDDEDELGEGCKWRPSIFMPRWASRLLLEITEVRVQRVQEISEEDARAEGAIQAEHGQWAMEPGRKWEESLLSARCAFANYFNRLHGGPRWNIRNHGYGVFDLENPWVWALTFKVVPHAG